MSDSPLCYFGVLLPSSVAHECRQVAQAHSPLALATAIATHWQRHCHTMAKGIAKNLRSLPASGVPLSMYKVIYHVAMLCYTRLRWATLCYATLRYDMLCYSRLGKAMLLLCWCGLSCLCHLPRHAFFLRQLIKGTLRPLRAL